MAYGLWMEMEMEMEVEMEVLQLDRRTAGEGAAGSSERGLLLLLPRSRYYYCDNRHSPSAISHQPSAMSHQL